MANDSIGLGIQAPSYVNAGDIFNCEVSFRNSGNTVWTTNRYKVGSLDPMDNMNWGINRILLSRNIDPWNDLNKNIVLTAPLSTGNYKCAWGIVEEGVQWFGLPISIDIEIKEKVPFIPLPRFAVPDDLCTFTIFDSGRYVVNNIFRTFNWRNTTGKTISIKGIYKWTGIDTGGIVDTHFQVVRLRDGSHIGYPLQWDHYAEPVAPNHDEKDWFYPNTYKVHANEELQFGYYTSYDVNGNKGLNAHHICQITI